MPDRLTFDTVAIPEPLVTALPAAVPFNVKLMVLLATPDPLALSVADNVVVPPKVPVAAATASDVGAAVPPPSKNTPLITALGEPVLVTRRTTCPRIDQTRYCPCAKPLMVRLSSTALVAPSNTSIVCERLPRSQFRPYTAT